MILSDGRNSFESAMRFIPVSCTGCGNTIMRRISDAKRVERQGLFTWCDECWPERKRELDRAYTARHKESRNAKRRKVKPGQRGVTSKLSKNDIDFIRCLHDGGCSNKHIAHIVGIAPSWATRIINGYTPTNLREPNADVSPHSEEML